MQLALDDSEIQTGQTVGTTSWLAAGLSIQEDQLVRGLGNIKRNLTQYKVNPPAPHCKLTVFPFKQNKT